MNHDWLFFYGKRWGDGIEQEVSNLQTAGQIPLVKPFNPAREDILLIIMKN